MQATSTILVNLDLCILLPSSLNCPNWNKDVTWDSLSCAILKMGRSCPFVVQGWKVTGSDLADSPMLVSLREAGITAHVGHCADHITDAACPVVVVVSSAIPPENPEIQRAKELGVQV